MSEQIHVIDPRVSIDSRFLTRTFFFAIHEAVTARLILIVAIKFSGTIAMMIPIEKIKQKTIPYPNAIPIRKNMIPTIEAIIVMILIN